MLAEGCGNSDEWENIYAELKQYYGENYPPLQGVLEHKAFLEKISVGGKNA